LDIFEGSLDSLDTFLGDFDSGEKDLRFIGEDDRFGELERFSGDL